MRLSHRVNSIRQQCCVTVVYYRHGKNFCQTLSRMHTASGIWRAWDAQVSRLTFAVLGRIGWKVHPISKLTQSWPAVDSPCILVTCLLVYLLVVCVGGVRLRGKSETNHVKAWLKPFVIFHNIFLIVLSAYMCFGCASQAYKNGYNFWGSAYNPSEVHLAKFIYIFFISKIYEFVDTFIMLMKGNINQVSFLHVYHHATISFIWWMIVRVAPGGDAYFSAALNSWVHVCMYSYYLLAILIGKDDSRRKKYLWWGRYLTQMQMFQFVLNLLQALYCSRFSTYPKFLSEILIFYMGTLLALFGQFYYSKHISPSTSTSQKQE